MTNITSINWRCRQSELVLPLAALGLLIVTLALATLPARLAMVFSDDTKQALLEKAAAVDDASLNAFIASRESALHWRRAAQTYDDLATGYLIKAERAGFKSADGEHFLEKAMTDRKNALGRAPADTYGWAQLAYLDSVVEGPGADAAEALTHSIETDPFEPRLTLSRISMIVMLGNRLNEGIRGMLPGMIRAAWREHPDLLAYMAHDRHFITIVEAALAGDPAALSQFAKLVDY